MTTAHQWLADGLVVVTFALVFAAAWSAILGRRSLGLRDHRFAVDRLVLAAIAIVIVEALVGVAVAFGGGRPADPLHLLYGPLAGLALPVAYGLGGRTIASRGDSRVRRDLWILVGALLLLGFEGRLYMTG
jgi:hypothetical protein